MKQPTHKSILRYRLAPDAEALLALNSTFAAYAEMADILDDLATEKGSANLVTLHELAYETVRERTGLPARMVTLGLRDFTARRDRPGDMRYLPLDEKLFAIKGPSHLTVSTVHGRIGIAYDVAGYSPSQPNIFAAELVKVDGGFEIQVAVTRHTDQPEETKMQNEGILSRMGRLIAGLANSAVDRAEGVNKVAIVEQALREIDAAADEARTDIGKARAEEFRIQSRREEIAVSLRELDEKIRLAVASDRNDLAKAGVARQIDLESQIAALDKALADARDHMAEGQQALQAVLATRREAEARLADLRQSLLRHPETDERQPGHVRATNGAARAAAAVSRVTGVPSTASDANAELDELDRLHRERAIEARLARFRADKS